MTIGLPKINARFKAKYLYAVRRILRSAQKIAFERDCVGLLVEPSERGVFVIATDGVCLAVIHDSDGYANKPFRVLLPKAFVKRAGPPKPIRAFLEGDFELELPEWAQPGDIYLTGICALIFPKMNHPSIEDPEYAPALENMRIETGNIWRKDDYRIKEDVTIPWRKILERPRGQRGQVCLDPEILWRMEPIETLAPNADNFVDYHGNFVFEMDADCEGPIIVREASTPEFVGAIMPHKMRELPAMPDWVSSTPFERR